MNADGQTVSGYINFIPLAVGIVEGRSFSDLCPFLCYLSLCQLRALYKGTGHASRLERVPLIHHSRVNSVTPRSFKVHSLPPPALLSDVYGVLDIRSRPRNSGSGALPDNYSTI